MGDNHTSSAPPPPRPGRRKESNEFPCVHPSKTPHPTPPHPSATINPDADPSHGPLGGFWRKSNSGCAASPCVHTTTHTGFATGQLGETSQVFHCRRDCSLYYKDLILDKSIKIWTHIFKLRLGRLSWDSCSYLSSCCLYPTSLLLPLRVRRLHTSAGSPAALTSSFTQFLWSVQLVLFISIIC